MQRLAIFVDGSNLFYCQRDRLGWWIDWRRLLTYSQRQYEVIEAYYYRAEPGKGASDFAKRLVSSGYTLRGKPLKEIADESSGHSVKKGNMDVELVIDALNTSPRYDACLLVSGDGDFVPLVEELRSRGKAVSVLSTLGSVAFELRGAVGMNFHDLRTLRSEIEYLALPSTTGFVPEAEEAERQHDVITGSDGGVVTGNMAAPAIAPSTEVASESSVEKSVEASVVRFSGGGAVLKAADGTEFYMPVTNLHLTGYVSDLPALIQIGERFSVEVVSLDERRSPPTKIVGLANGAECDQLQQRLDELALSLKDLSCEGEFELEVQAVKAFGAFFRNSWNTPVLLHRSAMGIGYVPDCTKLMRPGEKVRVRVIGREQSADGPRINAALADEQYRRKLLERLAVASISLP